MALERRNNMRRHVALAEAFRFYISTHTAEHARTHALIHIRMLTTAQWYAMANFWKKL